MARSRFIWTDEDIAGVRIKRKKKRNAVDAIVDDRPADEPVDPKTKP